jgi:hypothetical protein
MVKLLLTSMHVWLKVTITFTVAFQIRVTESNMLQFSKFENRAKLCSCRADHG